jgi:cytochrome c oxidase accessory protein FixG
MYMCPWPRIQAAMLDPSSLVVTYRDWRGEPRGKHRKRAGAEALGDCIDCNACVAVCPMGIDIRDGQQMGCITCALCIDACDEVMEKIGKPKGLIAYATLADEARAARGEATPPVWRRIVRPRTILYFTLWSGIGLAMVATLFMRDAVDISVARDRNPVFVTLSDGSVRNAYTVKVSNRNAEPRAYRLSLTGERPLTMEIHGIAGDAFDVDADQVGQIRVFLTGAPDPLRPERLETRFWVEDLTSRERASYDTVFIGPPK